MARVHWVLLKIYQRLPSFARRWVVRRLTPSYTVGAICVIERDDGARLLVRQAYRKRWGLPGGLAKRREPIVACALREVREEVGVEVELAGEPAVVVDPVPRRIDVVFPARLVSQPDAAEIKPRSPEIDEVAWFLPSDMPPLQHETVSALVALARHTEQQVGADQATPKTSSAV